MMKELCLVALCAVIYFGGEADASYQIMTNPKGYGSYKCPKGYERANLDYANRNHWTFMLFGTKDPPICALKGVKESRKCYKPGSKKSKFWMTYRYGYAEFHITKFDRFSNMDSGLGTDISTPSKGSSTSYTRVPQYFAVRAFYFKVRGAYKIVIYFNGDISKKVTIEGNALDWRKKTWVCIKWETFPIFKNILFTLQFDRKRKAKVWDLCMFSCCETLSDKVVVGKK